MQQNKQKYSACSVVPPLTSPKNYWPLAIIREAKFYTGEALKRPSNTTNKSAKYYWNISYLLAVAV